MALERFTAAVRNREKAVNQLNSLTQQLHAGWSELKVLLPKGASQRTLIEILQGGKVIRRFVTVPEGMPSIMVAERLAAQPNLTGDAGVPPEGSVLPDTYEIAMGEPRLGTSCHIMPLACDMVLGLVSTNDAT